MKIFKCVPIVLALLSNTTHADESQIACNLERSKTEVIASILEAPTAFGSVGDSSTSEKNITLGVAQSLSGRSQAALIRQSAAHKCDSIKASVHLDSYAQWAQLQVQRAGALEELRTIEQVLIMVKDNISDLEIQMTAGIITLDDHAQAVNTLIEIEKKQSELTKLLAVSMVVPPETNVLKLIEILRVHESQASELAARSQAETGWDTVISAGVRQPMSGNRGAQPFATIGFKWSFGYSAAQDAVRAVGVQTAELMRAQQHGYAHTVLRQRETIKQLIKVEVLEMSAIKWHMENFKLTRAIVTGIDTKLALNTVRSVNLQLMIMESQLAGATARLNGYKSLWIPLI